MEKINCTIGRFQPFTKGHLNMINEGNGPCIIYKINTSDNIPKSLKGWKVKSRIVRPESINKIIDYIETQNCELTEQEKDILKRPFNNELIDKELQIIKKTNKNIIDIVPVVNMFDALMKFNKFITDNSDKYEPQYLMCGDDRAEAYTENIDKYDILDDQLGSGIKITNVLKGKLKVNIGTGRIEGISGTDVRKAILNKDKATFEKIIPQGVEIMFDEFINAFDKFKAQLKDLIK